MPGAGSEGLDGWSALHGGARPSILVRGWLRGVQRIAAHRTVARVPPDVISAAGVLATAAALAGALAGGAWVLLSAALVLLAGLLDGLDGAVALRTGRARPLGAVVDAVADRIGDLLLVAVVAALGGPPLWCGLVAALVLLHEYLRARANAAGMRGPGAVTVAERPTRIALVAVTALGAGVWPAGTPWTGWAWGAVAAAGWLALGAVGLAQLLVGVLRTIPRDGPA